jgi:hypothetical protein
VRQNVGCRQSAISPSVSAVFALEPSADRSGGLFENPFRNAKRHSEAFAQRYEALHAHTERQDMSLQILKDATSFWHAVKFSLAFFDRHPMMKLVTSAVSQLNAGSVQACLH